MTDTAGALKVAVAREAVRLVQDGMKLGLGSGSTAELFLIELGKRVTSGLRVVGVPTSDKVAALAEGYGIPLSTLADVGRLDLAIDGADEIQLGTLALVKGRGGALLREKLVAAAADRFCIIADSSKLVTRLAEKQPVPVAVVPFGWTRTAERIKALGGEPGLRLADGIPFISDDGLYILDCRFAPIEDAAALDTALKATLGVVDHGLFVGMAERAIVAGTDGVVTLETGAAGA
jgi:ribose 5-phosphate isomerase A